MHSLFVIRSSDHPMFVRGAIRYVLICWPTVRSRSALVHINSRLVPCKFLLLAPPFFGFININYCLISSGVGAISFDIVIWFVHIVLKWSLLTLSMTFDAMLTLFLVDSSGSLLLLMLSRSSKNRSINLSPICLLFSKLIMAWCPFIPDIPEPKAINNLLKILSDVSRFSSFFATTHFSFEPSRLLRIAVHACLPYFKMSCSSCNLITSTHVSMHPAPIRLVLDFFRFLQSFSRYVATSFSFSRQMLQVS